jgi:hypothetical protein
LAKRKIIKVKRPSTTIPTAATVPTAASTTEGNGQKQDDTDTKKSNPFATALSGFSARRDHDFHDYWILWLWCGERNNWLWLCEQ